VERSHTRRKVKKKEIKPLKRKKAQVFNWKLGALGGRLARKKQNGVPHGKPRSPMRTAPHREKRAHDPTEENTPNEKDRREYKKKHREKKNVRKKNPPTKTKQNEGILQNRLKTAKKAESRPK